MELLAYMDPCETHVFPLKFSTSNVCVKSFQSGDILANCLKSVWHEEKEKATAKPLSNSEDRICPIESHGSVFNWRNCLLKWIQIRFIALSFRVMRLCRLNCPTLPTFSFDKIEARKNFAAAGLKQIMSKTCTDYIRIHCEI